MPLSAASEFVMQELEWSGLRVIFSWQEGATPRQFGHLSAACAFNFSKERRDIASVRIYNAWLGGLADLNIESVLAQPVDLN